MPGAHSSATAECTTVRLNQMSIDGKLTYVGTTGIDAIPMLDRANVVSTERMR